MWHNRRHRRPPTTCLSAPLSFPTLSHTARSLRCPPPVLLACFIIDLFQHRRHPPSCCLARTSAHPHLMPGSLALLLGGVRACFKHSPPSPGPPAHLLEVLPEAAHEARHVASPQGPRVAGRGGGHGGVAVGAGEAGARGGGRAGERVTRGSGVELCLCTRQGPGGQGLQEQRGGQPRVQTAYPLRAGQRSALGQGETKC